ncbi:MAG: SGNH/GDSL hydrolase family protein [Myxococcaceae bacterium]
MAASTHDQLELISKKKVFFAHQSVGQNLVDGVTKLAFDEHVMLRVVPYKPGALSEPGLVHAQNGVNGQPETKLKGFGELLSQTEGADLAAMKLCYVDFTPDTDAAALFAKFKAAHDEVKQKHPGLKVMVITTPLTTVQRGLKAALKNKLGGGAYGERENVKRHQFNELIRKEYQGKEPFFDLAALESGSGTAACTFERDGQTWPCLRDEITDDGGHLNANGQRQLATAWVAALAEALR